MKFGHIYRGFYKGGKGDKAKAPAITREKAKDINNLFSYQNINQFENFLGYLNDDYILVDLDNKINGIYDDNKTESKLLIEILKHYGIDTPIVETTHGHHFIFKCPADITNNITGELLPIGLRADYKLGSKWGWQVLKHNGNIRTIINDTGEVAELPQWLKYDKRLKNKLETLDNERGVNGRNNFLSSYKYQLLKCAYSEADTYLICEIINNYLMYEPVNMKEFTSLMRVEPGLMEEVEEEQKNINKLKSFYDVGENGKSKLSTERVAKYIIEQNTIILIDSLIYSFNGRYYERLHKQDVKRFILNLIPGINSSQWAETAAKVEGFATKKEISKGYTTFLNGNINFNTNDVNFMLEPHNKDIITTFIVPTEYIQNIDTSFIEKYLRGLVCNDDSLYDNLIQSIGYLFYPNNFLQECLIIKGRNRNGKSTFLKFLTETLGNDNISNVGLKQLTSRFGASAIVGKPFNIVDDISDEYIEISEKFKQAVTGDPLEIEEKGQTPFRYKQIVKMMFTCNTIPKMKDPTGANKRRIRPLPFENIYCEANNNLDPFLLEKLITEHNKSSLLKLSIEGLKTLLIMGKLPTSQKIELLRDEFDEDNNPIKLFIKDVMFNEFEEMYRFLNKKNTKEAYREYEIWSSQNGYKTMSSHTFMRQLKENIPNLISKKYSISYYNKSYRYEFSKPVSEW